MSIVSSEFPFPEAKLSSLPRHPAVLGHEAVNGFLETRLPVFFARLGRLAATGKKIQESPVRLPRSLVQPLGKGRARVGCRTTRTILLTPPGPHL